MGGDAAAILTIRGLRADPPAVVHLAAAARIGQSSLAPLDKACPATYVTALADSQVTVAAAIRKKAANSSGVPLGNVALK